MDGTDEDKIDLKDDCLIHGIHIAGSPLGKIAAKNYVQDLPSWVKKQSLFCVLHVSYFLILGFSGALILWISPQRNSEHMTFIDALYCAISALTVTGLLSVRIQSLTKFQQTVLLLLTVLGSHIFTSLLPLYSKRLAYKKIFKSQDWDRILSKRAHITVSIPEPDCGAFSEAKKSHIVEDIHTKDAFSEDIQQHTDPREITCAQSIFSVPKRLTLEIWNKVIDLKLFWRRRPRRSDWLQEQETCLDRIMGVSPELSFWKSRILEYQALMYLSRIVIAYFLIVQIVGFLVIHIYLSFSADASHILQKNDINKTFFTFYNAVTSFANSGFTLLDSSMVPFREHTCLLFVFGILILAGNTMFAPCLWMTIWMLHRFTAGKNKEIYEYILTNPRTCYTHLFPHNQTLWLVVTVMGFNTVHSIFFCVMDWNSNSLNGLSPGRKLVNSIFQSVATRNAGLNVVDVGNVSPSMLVLFVGMMYISVYPLYLTRQKTRALRDQHARDTDYYDREICVQSRKLLAKDSAHLFIIVFILCIIEGNNTVQDPLNYSIFNIIFEGVLLLMLKWRTQHLFPATSFFVDVSMFTEYFYEESSRKRDGVGLDRERLPIIMPSTDTHLVGISSIP
eukprot:Gb_37190 [translate_table: standard]